MRPMDGPNRSGCENSLAMAIEIFYARDAWHRPGAARSRNVVRLDAIELLITDQLPEPELPDALAAAEV